MIDTILLFAGLFGVVFSAIYTFKNKISYFKGIFLGAISMLGAFLLSVVKSVAIYGENPIDSAISGTFSYVKSGINALSQDELASMLGSGILKADILSMVEDLRVLYTTLFPAIIIVVCAISVLMLYIVIRAVLKLLGKDVSYIPKFSEIYLTKSALIATVFSIIMAYALSGTVMGNAFANIEFLFVTYILLCGWSVIDYALCKKIPYGFVRFLIYAAASLLFGSFFGIVIYIGVFVAIVDAFKKFRKKAKES